MQDVPSTLNYSHDPCGASWREPLLLQSARIAHTPCQTDRISIPMEFDELLSQFRSLGGVADNIVSRLGVRGRGLFAVNPARPVRVRVPTHLLVSPQWIALDDSANLIIAALHRSMLSPEAVDFFEQYQRHFGWGNGGLHTIRQHQLQLQSLPPALKHYLELLGGGDELKQPPTARYCLQKYCVNRQIRIQSESRLMPIAEMINHDADGLPYVLRQGVQVSGTVHDEVLTRYHSQLDAFNFFINYHFVTPAPSVLSCEVTVEVPGAGMFRIARNDHLAQFTGGTRSPQVTRAAGVTHLSFVEIANQNHPLQPRQNFRALLAKWPVRSEDADALFDGLVEHNQHVLNGLTQACRDHPGAIASSLGHIAFQQLAALAEAT